MVYQKRYPGGWKNKPDASTPFDAATGNHMEQGILEASQKAELAVQNTPEGRQALASSTEVSSAFARVGDTAPDGNTMPVWFDSSTTPPTLKVWDGLDWVLISTGGTTPPDPVLYGLTTLGAGDSIEGVGGNGLTQMGDSPSAYTAAIVGDRDRFVGVVQRSGNTAAQWETNGLPTLLDLIETYKVNTVPVLLGTNDAGSVAFEVNAFRATLIRIYDAIEAAGARPWPRTIPPRGDSTEANGRVASINAVIRQLATSRGYALLDYWSAAADPDTLLWKTGYSIDGVHPTPLGVKGMVLGTADVARENYFPADAFFPATAAADALNLAGSRGLFAAGGGNGNANVGAGFRTFSTALTPTFVTDARVPGRMQKLALSGVAGSTQFSSTGDPILVTAGHRIRFGAAMITSGFETTAAKTAKLTYSIGLLFRDSSGAAVGGIDVVYGWESDLDLCFPNFAQVAPAGAVTATINISIGYDTTQTPPPGAYIQVGAVVARDLDTVVAGAPTSTTLAASPAGTSGVGAPVTLTATVSPAIAGTVQFKDGSTTLGEGIVSGSTATLTTSALTSGSHSLVAAFLPSGTDYEPSQSAALAYTVGEALHSSGVTGAVHRWVADQMTSPALMPDAIGAATLNAETGVTLTLGTLDGRQYVEQAAGAVGFLTTGAPGSLDMGSVFTVAAVMEVPAVGGSTVLSADGFAWQRLGNGGFRLIGNGHVDISGTNSWAVVFIVANAAASVAQANGVTSANAGTITGPNTTASGLDRLSLFGASAATGTRRFAEVTHWPFALDATQRAAHLAAMRARYPFLPQS